MSRLLVVYGTRPEAIKLAPVVRVLRETDHATVVCHTGQHPKTGIVPPHATDLSVDVVTENQTLSELNARVQSEIYRVLTKDSYDYVIVQGDTATAMFSAAASTLCGVPVAHIEAGLRTGRLDEPWPEELHRIGLTALASVHFAPTEDAADNIRREGFSPTDIHVVGNTIVDALHAIPKTERIPNRVLVTTHRRENLSDNFDRIKTLLRRCAQSHANLSFDLLLHPNPAVQDALGPLASVTNITLHQPEPHNDFVERLAQAWVVMTDSGGVQEEASILGTPCLVVREVTDRPEIVAAGAARVVGRNAETASTALLELQNPDNYAKMQNARSLFGDGQTAKRIVTILETYL